MSDRINPVDQGMLGKIANKVGEAGTAKKVDSNPSAPGRESPSAAVSTDTVELTSSAKLLERLEKTLASIPDVDQTRVDAVKSQIENGQYSIDSDQIAEAMLRLDNEIDRRN